MGTQQLNNQDEFLVWNLLLDKPCFVVAERHLQKQFLIFLSLVLLHL